MAGAYSGDVKNVPTDLNSRRSEATLALAIMPEVIHIVNRRGADFQISG
jgi:hypothetical protein